MASTVTLEPTEEWSIEWRSSGNDSYMLLSSHYDAMTEGMTYIYNDGKFHLGQNIGGNYKNYGIASGNTKELHTFRFENRIAEDGTNTIYMVVDGMEIGAVVADAYNKTYTFNSIGAAFDIFPLNGVKETWETVKNLYAAAGTPDNCRLVIGEGSHRFYADDAWPVVKELLAKFRIAELQ
jgi:hypothetical protein